MNFKYVVLINLHKCWLWGKVERPVETLRRFRSSKCRRAACMGA